MGTSIISGAAGAVVAVVVGDIEGILQWIILVAAAVASLAVLNTKIIRPVVQMGRRVNRGVDLLLEMPSMADAIYVKLEEHDARLRVIEQNSQPAVQAFVKREIKNA